MGVAHGRGPGCALLWVVAEEKVGFEPMSLVAIVNGLQ